jgi:peptidoglycan/xylan/chitin deacetylase (PgdA/CDA1 family)
VRWSPLLKIAKRGVLHPLRWSGFTAIVARSEWRRSRLVILCYHGVALEDEHRWHPSLFITAEGFRGRLRLLRDRGYAVLPLGEAVARLFEGLLPPRAAAITFDDGLYDFHAEAFPALRAYGFPATVYLTSYYCQDQRPVFDSACAYILWKAGPRALDGEPFVGAPGTLGIRTAAERADVHARIRRHAAAAGLSAAAKDDLARRLAGRLDVDYDRIVARRLFHLMTPGEVREVAGHSIDVQLHTHRHRTPRDREGFDREIADNRRAIDTVIGESRLEHFCYPNGDIAPCFLPWLAAGGVRTATTCEPGLASGDDDPLMLPRVVDSAVLSPVEFETWLSGLSTFVPTLRRSRDWRRHGGHPVAPPTADR